MADAGVLLSQVGVIQNVFPYKTIGNTYLTCWKSLEKELLKDSKDFSTLFQPLFSEANKVTDAAFDASQILALQARATKPYKERAKELSVAVVSVPPGLMSSRKRNGNSPLLPPYRFLTTSLNTCRRPLTVGQTPTMRWPSRPSKHKPSPQASVSASASVLSLRWLL